MVLPIYNEVAILQQVLDKYIKDLNGSGREFEIIAVNDGCTDGTEDILAAYARKYRNFKVINLDGRYGKQIGTIAGFDAVDKKSSAVILADIDMLNPVGIFEKVISRIASGESIIYAKREVFGFSKIRALYNDFVVRIGARAFGIDGHYTGKTNIAAFSRPVFDVLQNLPHRSKYMRAMDTWFGWRIEYMTYASGYSRIEEHEVLRELHHRAVTAPRVRGSKPVTRDKVREHTAAKDVMWGCILGATLLLLGGIYFAAFGGVAVWSHVLVWAAFAGFSSLAAALYIKVILIKRIGTIDDKTVDYNIKNIVNT